MRLFALLFCSFASAMSLAAEVVDIEKNIRMLGFDHYYETIKRSRPGEPVKIAILDYGFGGYEKEKGYTIPDETILKRRPDDKSTLDPTNKHGLVMAQIITQYMTADYERWYLAPEIYLYKADGYTNFEWSIYDAINNNVDIILHSIVMEYGGNYDGKGFFNSLVNNATQAGIIWINAAGNFGLTTYNSNVKLSGKSKWVDFGLENNAVPIECDLSREKRKNKKCPVRLVLAWDDFKNEPLVGSTKDLDLFLYDKNFEAVVSSQMTQIEYNDKRSGDAGTTLYPREIIETEISEGTSYIKVRAKTDNFSSRDVLRITADGENVSFPYRDKKESLLNPADNPNVITVGEDSDRSSVSASLNKPELVAPSLVKDEDGLKYRGSSNAAAVVAAGVGLMKKLNTRLDREDILQFAGTSTRGPRYQRPEQFNIPNSPWQNSTRNPMGPPIRYPRQPPINNPNMPMHPQFLNPYGFVPHELDAKFVQSNHQYADGPTNPGSLAIPLEMLGFGPPPGVGCFPLVNVDSVEPCTVADFIIKSQGILVATTQGPKIATTFDPLMLLQDMRTGGPDMRASFRDVVAIAPAFDPRGMFLRLPRGKPLPPGAIEIFQVPMNAIPCKLPDWDFMNRQRDIARDHLYASTRNHGADTVPISPMCDPRYMAQMSYPVSNWSMYPSLRYSPYVAPVGPLPVDVNARPPVREHIDREPAPQRERFRMPNPHSLKDGKDETGEYPYETTGK